MRHENESPYDYDDYEPATKNEERAFAALLFGATLAFAALFTAFGYWLGS